MSRSGKHAAATFKAADGGTGTIALDHDVGRGFVLTIDHGGDWGETLSEGLTEAEGRRMAEWLCERLGLFVAAAIG